MAKVQLLVQDRALTADEVKGSGADLARETKELKIPEEQNDRFVDGPACRRVAVVDFDPRTSEPLTSAARFVPSKPGSVRGSYPDDGDPESPASIAINAFGIVFQTIRMFEGPDALGRQVSWAFDGDQLLVVPRAGEWENSFYERATRSLQFFWFTPTGKKPIYLALSRDIVAHECGHALLDAVVPSLYDCSTAQSLAIHEAFADLVAVLMALDSGALRTAVLKRSNNTLGGANAFSTIAEEFGRATPGPGGIARTELRDLSNNSTLPELAGERPHVLSTVLSSIFYDTLRSIFTRQFDAEVAKSAIGETDTTVSDRAANKALPSAQIIFRRLLLRGIDYLPPGELSFADVGRATFAADKAIYPDTPAIREQFAQYFVTREVVAAATELDCERPHSLDLTPARLPEIRDSDWAAYQYVETHRDVLGMPPGRPFTVLPRVDSTKATGGQQNGQRLTKRELILKVAWNHDSEDDARQPAPTGATVSLSWQDGTCLALVLGGVALQSDESSHG
ncbi:hypothetical protein AB0L64_13650 [Kribbella sp. NPDC051936]|uniref:hypothetical protein n=1 Tax=Kribbella sp. NPDC051936 TaxID=3154946 RepID=UPI00343AE5F5